MTHLDLDDALREQAALFALGALDDAAAADYRRHLVDCDACRAEVAWLAGSTASLGLLAAPVAPSPAVRARVLAEAGGYVFLPANAGGWRTVAPGIERRDLAAGASSRSYLIRMAPGAVGGRHAHAWAEHCLVLEGDFHVAGTALGVGDFHLAAAGSVHDGNRTQGGCLLLLVEAP